MHHRYLERIIAATPNGLRPLAKTPGIRNVSLRDLPVVLVRLRERLGSQALQAHVALLEQKAIMVVRIAHALTTATSLP